ncbi:hypothetical protein FSP39_008742 [Pinctada imbricata]|uniref:G-protein coupled receptors family 1 profile domain-containing protein n=1 Tax=Pinctada imbricata TaxID=66713 RepID=A0AA89BJ84_PINIB|nr:hypothetical protein FSP39_008742 [Pinctada imbricata]
MIVVLLLFIVVGNLCVLLAIRLSETGRKTRMNFFIMHLAVSDLLVGLILVPSDLWDKIAIDWTLGDFSCKFREFLKLYVLSLAMAAFFIPALIITVCYTVIIFIICNKSKTQSNSSQQRGIPIGNGADECESVVHHVGTTSNVIQQAKTRTIKMTFIIVLVFVLCWSPFFVFLLVQVFYLNNRPALSDDISGITTLMMSLAPLNSAVNPLIYGVFSTRICRNLR